MNAPWSFPGCPSPPDWRLDWQQLLKTHAWLKRLEGVPQEAEYHAEGDVLTHTCMVAQAMTSLGEWRQLFDMDRQVLFAAALLHDVGKPDCTRAAEDGSILSKKHARRGELLSRQLLWEGGGQAVTAPFPIREQVCQLVRHHGLPLWFMEKSSPARKLIQASLAVRLDQLALLAEADVRGRQCRDQAELLSRIELFREYARELRCLDQPRQFASPHSRFVYFHNTQVEPNPDYEAYDTTEFEVVLMSGLPGVGKDTWIASKLPGLPVISLDDIRRETDTSPEDEQGRVVQLARERARQFLRAKQPFVWNATNLTRMVRRSLIDLFTAYPARVRIVYLAAPLDVISQRNRSRNARVPERVIQTLLDRLEIPTLDEAHFVDWVA
jgi:putative nucleotidyltransferase with HDIG domain